jgi:hypothetical protein
MQKDKEKCALLTELAELGVILEGRGRLTWICLCTKLVERPQKFRLEVNE